jgi:hypothetical protein
MHLVQILLPTADNDGRPFDEEIVSKVQKTLTDKFGGVTAHIRAPAKGVWSHHGKHAVDDIVTVEVMVEKVDHAWWKEFRTRLERELRQEQIVIRVQAIELI